MAEVTKELLSEYLCANMFDGDRVGTVTMSIDGLLQEVVDLVFELQANKECFQ